MNRVIQRPSRPAWGYRFAFACFVLLAFGSLLAVAEEGDHVEHHHHHPSEEEAEMQAHHHHHHHHEDPPVKQQEDSAVQEEEPPAALQEDPPVQEEEPPAALQEESPVQEAETPAAPKEEAPPLREEAPPLREKAPPLQEKKPPVKVEPEEIDASLFEIKVFECTAPHGQPATDREGRLPPSAILTLCFRPEHKDAAELKSIEFMEFTVPNGPTQKAIETTNESVGPMTRLICPMMDDPDLCIVATKLSDDFFAKAFNNVAAVGELNVLVDSEQRRVPFRYEFSTAQLTKMPPVEHEFYEMPTTPASFPCSQEVRLWLLAAVVLTLLEFAFSPSDTKNDKSAKDTTNAANSTGTTASKKKKPKKE